MFQQSDLDRHMGSCYMKRAKKAASVEDFIVTSDLGLTSDDDLLPSGGNSPLSSGTKTTVPQSCMSCSSSQSNSIVSTAPSQSPDTVSISEISSENAQPTKDAILKQSIRDIIFQKRARKNNMSPPKGGVHPPEVIEIKDSDSVMENEASKVDPWKEIMDNLKRLPPGIPADPCMFHTNSRQEPSISKVDSHRKCQLSRPTSYQDAFAEVANCKKQSGSITDQALLGNGTTRFR